MFQLLDLEQVIKLDLYVRCLIPGELDRSVPTEVFPGVTLPLAARTDAALSKLVWIHRGSHRSRRDLRWILARATPDEVATGRQTGPDTNLCEPPAHGPGPARCPDCPSRHRPPCGRRR